MTLQIQIKSIKIKEGGYLNAQEEYFKRYSKFEKVLAEVESGELEKVLRVSTTRENITNIFNVHPDKQHLYLKDFLKGKYLSEEFKEKLITKKFGNLKIRFRE